MLGSINHILPGSSKRTVCTIDCQGLLQLQTNTNSSDVSAPTYATEGYFIVYCSKGGSCDHSAPRVLRIPISINRVKMRFPEPKTLREATSPVILAGWLFAIGILEYPIGYPRPMISLCWSLAHLFVYLGLVILAESSYMTQTQKSMVLVGTDHLFILSSIFSIILFLYLGRMTAKKLAASIRNLDKVNEILSKYEIPKEYRLIYKYQVIQLTGGFVFMGVMLALTIFVISFNNSFRMKQIGYLVSVHYMPICSFIVDCTFSTLIRYIGNRFQHLNANLMQCSSQENFINPFHHHFELDGSLRPMIFEIHANPYSFRLANQHWIMQLILDSRKIHQELCSTARTLNEAFSTQILLSMTISFVLITTRLYGVYDTFITSTTVWSSSGISIIMSVIIVCSLIFYIAKVLIIVCVCSLTSTQAQRTGEIIHQLERSTSNRQVREEIQAFSLLLIQNPLRFTAREFLTLDYEMICSMVGTVTTYLVIIIQLENIYGREPGSWNAPSRAINATY